MPEHHLTTYIFYVKVPDGPVVQWYFRGCCHSDVVEVLGARMPVLLTFDLEGEHNDCKTAGVPNTHHLYLNSIYI